MIASIIAVFDGGSSSSNRSNVPTVQSFAFRTTTGTNGTAGTIGTRAQRTSMNCDGPRTVHTIGHSTRTIEAFIELLNAHAIQLLVDVRRWPGSKRHPQFNREALNASLKSKGIEYLWRGDLGGFRKPKSDSPNTAWRVSTFRAYADFMLTDEFERIMNEMETIAHEKRIAVMCAEAVPWRCHRQLLADAFIVRGWSVCDIMDDGCLEHALPAFARVEGARIYYSGV